LIYPDTASDRDLNPPEPPPMVPGGNAPPGDQPPAGEPTASGEDVPSPAEKMWARAFAKYREAVKVDVATWRRGCLQRAKAGRKPKLQFKSTVILPAFRRDVASNLGSFEKRAPRPDDVRAVFDALVSVYGLAKAEPKPTKARAAAEKKIKRVVKAYLSSNVDKVVDWAVAEAAREVALHATKSDIPIDDPGGMADDLNDAEQGAAIAGVSDAAAAIGINLTKPPQAALDYATKRAGELVGKKLVAGTWVDNPDARYRIDDTLRERVKSAVAQSVEEGWSDKKLAANIRDAFGDSRARTIARTESGFSYGNGAATLYADNGVEMVEILDGDGCLPDSHEDDAPAPSGDPGVLDPDSEADGQIWTVDDYQENVLAHPNCVRAAVPYIPEGGAEPSDSGGESAGGEDGEE
jgi:hypothetical protein